MRLRDDPVEARAAYPEPRKRKERKGNESLGEVLVCLRVPSDQNCVFNSERELHNEDEERGGQHHVLVKLKISHFITCQYLRVPLKNTQSDVISSIV